MRYRTMFVIGMAVGYVLGSRAGRERYEQIRQVAQRVADNPSVQEAAGLVGAQVTKAAEVAKTKAENVLGDKVPFRSRNDADDTGTGWPDEEKVMSKSPY